MFKGALLEMASDNGWALGNPLSSPRLILLRVTSKGENGVLRDLFKGGLLEIAPDDEWAVGNALF